MKKVKSIILGCSLVAVALVPMFASAHGAVTPQAVDTKTLPPVGSEWREQNPYRGQKEAIKIGTSAYAENCARCHGLQAQSGGIAPDLRLLDRDCMDLKADAKKTSLLQGYG